MNNPANVEPYVQLRLRQAEAQRQFEHSDVAASERRARAEFDEADRIYRIKKQALIFAQINVKNSKLFQNLQSINNQCDRQAGAFPDSHLPHNFTQMMNQALIPPNDDDDVDSNDVNNIFSTEERKSLSTLNHSIAPSFYSIQPNLSTAPVNLSITTTHPPTSSYTSSSNINTSTTRETRPIVSVPPMESASALLSVLSRWPSINKTYSMRWQPNRVGACPKHVLRKERCPGASCTLWHNIERDLSINPLPPSVINEMDTMEQQLIAMKEQKRLRRKSTGVKPEDGTPATGAAAATPARKRARTESTGGDGAPNSANEHLPNLSDSPVVTTSLSKR